MKTAKQRHAPKIRHNCPECGGADDMPPATFPNYYECGNCQTQMIPAPSPGPSRPARPRVALTWKRPRYVQHDDLGRRVTIDTQPTPTATHYRVNRFPDAESVGPWSVEYFGPDAPRGRIIGHARKRKAAQALATRHANGRPLVRPRRAHGIRPR